MVKWSELPTFAYTPPEDHPAPPARPRASWGATGEDGARLEAFRWGSPLGEPFVLEVRRYGAPLQQDVSGPHEPAALETFGYDPAELPTLGELQAAADQCVPPGTLLLLAVFANGPDASYPAAAAFRAVRMIQAAMEVAGPPTGFGRPSGRGVRS